jgi:predicted Zn-dependent protease
VAFLLQPLPGIDPRGMADFFSTMSEQRESEIPQFLSTHPADVERQRALRERSAQLQGQTFTPLRLDSWPRDMQ